MVDLANSLEIANLLQIANFWLFGCAIAKVALLTGFAPGIAAIAIYKRVSGDGQLAPKRLDLIPVKLNPATSPSRKEWRHA